MVGSKLESETRVETEQNLVDADWVVQDKKPSAF